MFVTNRQWTVQPGNLANHVAFPDNLLRLTLATKSLPIFWRRPHWKPTYLFKPAVTAKTSSNGEIQVIFVVFAFLCPSNISIQILALISDFSSRPWRNLPPTWVIRMATRRPAHNMPIHMDLGPFGSTSEQHMKLQQPRNYDFRVSQVTPPEVQKW